MRSATRYDQRWIRISRPVVITGGELALEGLGLIYNKDSRIYEAPFQMKANCGWIYRRKRVLRSRVGTSALDACGP